MDENEWRKRSMGIPLDPDKQKDPEDAGPHVPAEGRREFLNDVGDQNGGQRTEVGPPYDGSGEVQLGMHGRYTGDELRRELEVGEVEAERKR